MKYIQNHYNDASICGIQYCNEKEEYKYFNKVLYSKYNLFKQKVGSMIIEFNFNDETIKAYGKTVKVTSSIGIKGLYRLVVDSMRIGDHANVSTYDLIKGVMDKV